MSRVVVTGGFDDLRSPQVRFLQEASRLGSVHVLLWSDETLESRNGTPPKFPQVERQYFLEALRYVDQVTPLSGILEPGELPAIEGLLPGTWAIPESEVDADIPMLAASHGLRIRIITPQDTAGLTLPDVPPPTPGRKKVIVTGCYDWLHTGHVRFFEEASEYGDLYVAAGNDANVLFLKGAGHPLFPEEERRYMAGSIRYVHEALITSGEGWMDAEPEIARIKPDIYLVNEDGDRPEKQVFCREHGLEYVVLKRLPKAGLPRRQSTDLRGF
jgi:cytidyltransferase-like protein